MAEVIVAELQRRRTNTVRSDLEDQWKEVDRQLAMKFDPEIIAERTAGESWKPEFLNPGGSVKDRAAWAIVKDAEEKGQLRPGGVIVEGTAGNTGIGLALVGRARGYRSVIVIPDTQSEEKKDMLRLCGADLRQVPAVPYKDPNNYVHVSGRLAEELAESEPNGAIWANQFDNVANRQGHYETTGPEIWNQTDGKVDGFICAVGTGGTLAGVAMSLRERNKDVVIGLADPMGARRTARTNRTGTLRSHPWSRWSFRWSATSVDSPSISMPSEMKASRINIQSMPA